MRLQEPGPPIDPPGRPDEPGQPTEEQQEARRRARWERRRGRTRKLADLFPGRFEFREGEYPDPGSLIGHNPMAAEYDYLREPEPEDE